MYDTLMQKKQKNLSALVECIDCKAVNCTNFVRTSVRMSVCPNGFGWTECQKHNSTNTSSFN